MSTGMNTEPGMEPRMETGMEPTARGTARVMPVINDAGTGVDAGGRIQVVEFNHDVYRLPTLNQMFGSHFHARGKAEVRFDKGLCRPCA
ncbi:MAG: hypothetical protein COC02_04320 [Rhodospirillaceae bacterium]|nr:MAG: hypothetical protein COC02_04320 [Rhodospirillaceae bacterium]